MPAASKVSGLNGAVEDGVVPAVKIKAGRCSFVNAFVALTFVAIPCVLLYAPRFSLPTPHGGAAAFLGSRARSGRVAEAHGGGGPVVPDNRVGSDVGRGATDGDGRGPVLLDNQVGSPCSSMPNHTICCDRSDYHSDVCFMSGDVRTDAATLSLLLFPPAAQAQAAQRIRPYTRKWDAYITKTIHEVTLRAAKPAQSAASHRCDVRHDAPAFVVTAAGYSHNLFHAFNDGILPAWVTSQHLRRRVVLAVLAYNDRWAGRFRELVAGLSAHRVVDLVNDNRTHCFPGAIVGTRYHDYLAVDPARLRDNRTIVDFHNFLANAYETRNTKPSQPAATTTQTARRKPRIGIVSRRGRRVIENEAAVARVAASAGFDVEVMETRSGGAAPPLAAVYARVRACDVLVGVHGADLTAFLFLRPGAAALVQVAPLGIALLSRNLFGVPAARMGLHYEQYDIVGDESSLSRKYPPGHVVLADPARARREQGSREWDLVEFVYLRGQNVSLDLGRFRETMARVHSVVMQRRSADADAASLLP